MRFYSIQDSEIVFFAIMTGCEIILAAMTGYGFAIGAEVPVLWAMPLLMMLVMVAAEIFLVVHIWREHREVEVVHHYPDEEPFQ